ncbi:MAG TPA: helix-turn-helix transcriptional regulator [Terriglobales bacterium]|nr:helix-turn-helix transcriptional regulator [Terriglobales bacterium]
MSHWAKPHEWIEDAVDLDIIEESALAMAQSTIQNAITKSGISRAEMARRMKCNRSLVSRLLSGSHNLTVKTMARSLAVCGFEVRFQPTCLEWNWSATLAPQKEAVPANAGTSSLRSVLSLEVPALAASGE